jgi:ribosomal protein L25 (general stress protein Ctc)
MKGTLAVVLGSGNPNASMDLRQRTWFTLVHTKEATAGNTALIYAR